jgi:hypothetical protein
VKGGSYIFCQYIRSLGERIFSRDDVAGCVRGGIRNIGRYISRNKKNFGVHYAFGVVGEEKDLRGSPFFILQKFIVRSDLGEINAREFENDPI